MMNEAFTTGQIISAILALCGAIITISSAISIVLKVLEKAKQPEKEQNEKISAVEKRVDEHDLQIKELNRKFEESDGTLSTINAGQKIIQTSILALLKHALNGNDIDALKEAEKSLDDYLINK